MLKRVVVTGMGVVSSIGNNVEEVTASLKEGKSGIRFQEIYAEKGFRSHVAGNIQNFETVIDRKHKRFMGDSALYTYEAMVQAIKASGLEDDQVSHLRTGLLAGSGGATTQDIVEANAILETRGIKRVGPYRVTSTMGSTVSACLATSFKIKGLNMTISSACATSAHCIGEAFEKIQWGKQDIVFAGGGEAEHYTQSVLFDAMGAFSSKYNDAPQTASRPYDSTRDGFVIAGGGGIVVLEELEHAKARGANILAEIVGYGTASDGYDMVAPSGDGAYQSMKYAIEQAGTDKIDYINTHGTSTPAGDIVEVKAMKRTFGEGNVPKFASTKSLTGHSLGAAGVHEAVYSLIMMQEKFIAASANVTNLDPEVEGLPLVQKRLDNQDIKYAMSNSFGFGGTNVSLVFKQYEA